MHTFFHRSFALASITAFALLAGCQTTPNTEAKKTALTDSSQAALSKFKAEDPTIDGVLGHSYGYVVFPDAGKGGLIVGGAYGRGTVYEQGKMIGYADLSQASIGAQIGGQSFAELIVFESKTAMDRFKTNEFAFSADASAVAIKSGVGASSKYENGVMIFVQPTGGLMAGVAVNGQKFTYVPSANATTAVEPKTTVETKTEVKEKTQP